MKMRSHLGTPGARHSRPADREVNYFEMWNQATESSRRLAQRVAELEGLVVELREKNKLLEEQLYNP